MKNEIVKGLIKIGLIIALIMLVLSIFCFYAINNQKQRNAKELAGKLLSSAEYYAVGQIMEHNIREVTINFPDNDLLNIKGNLPEKGYIKIKNASEIEMLFYYNGYCVSKGFEQSNFKFDKISEQKCLSN